MVTTEHESPIKIIRDNPEVVVQLMRLAFGVEVQPEFTIRSASEACTQLAPVAYTADNVVEICEDTATEQAAQMPELTILCTLANVTPHTRESMEIAHAALATIENEDAETGALYTGILLAVLARSAKKLLEEYVITGTPDFKFKNDPFLQYVAEGEVKGEAKAVLKVLAARGVSVPNDVRERVLACEDTEQLDRWLALAVTVGSADELFA